MIPASFIQDLLNRVDVVEVVGRYVQLKKGGANYMGLCPFHNEKSPSFTVSPTKQFYHCFGCGAHGTAIGFLIEYSGLGFVEAVKDLAQGVGMTVPEDDDRLPSAERARYQAKSLALSDAMTRACDFYRQKLRGSPEAIAYLQGRGLTGEIAARFGIGYAPQGWDGLRAVFEDYDATVLTEAGLVIEREAEDATARHKRYDRFRHRIMFPIRNSKGQVIGFGGRVLDGGEPKYLNSPETPLFQKGSELYGLFEARQAIREAGYALVTEGYMDVVALAQLGFPQTVATLGTACTSVHVQKLLRQTDRVVFSFDGDRAGQRAARRALEACLPQISDGKVVQFLFLPDQHDPDSYIRAAGGDEFARCINEAMPLSQFLLNEVTAGNDLRTAEGRAQAQFEAKPLLQALAPSALRLQIVRALAKLTLSTAEEIEALFSLSKPVAAIRKPRYSARRAPPLGLEQQILRLLIAQPRLGTELDADSCQAILQGAADGGQMLLQVLDAARELGSDANFAALAMSLQTLGAEYDGLIAELAGESENPIELARAELAGAVRQIKMRLLKEETEQLAASGLATEHDKQRFRDLILQQDALRKQGLAEAQQS